MWKRSRSCTRGSRGSSTSQTSQSSVPRRRVLRQRVGELRAAQHVPARGGQRLGDRVVVRGEERDHLLDAHRLALRHVEGEDLLDVVLHLVEVALHRHRLVAAEDAGARGLGDVDVRLPGPHLQRDGLRAERSRGDRVEVAALQLAIAGDHLVGHPAVEAGDHLDSTRPVLGCQRPLDAGLVAVGHAHEAAAAQHRLPAGAVTEAQHPLHHRLPDVVRVLGRRAVRRWRAGSPPRPRCAA